MPPKSNDTFERPLAGTATSWRTFLDPRKPLKGDAYALIGFVGFSIKFMLDYSIAKGIFHRHWNLQDYWWPRMNAVYLAGLAGREPAFVATLLLASIPFMIFGVLMTRRRLAALGLPAWFVVGFFIPLLNLPFFALLSVATPAHFKLDPPPPANSPTGLGRWIPSSALGSAVSAVGATAAGTLVLAKFNLATFRQYGFALFFFLPFVQGLMAAWLYGYRQPRRASESQAVALVSCVLSGALALALAMEGAICIFMAAPLWLVMAAMGAWVGWEMQSIRWHGRSKTTLLLLLVLSVPLLMGAEFQADLEDPTMSVRSALIIHAPPAVVWKHVIAFAELPPPHEWIFKAGVAYPMRAKIYGRGVGAVRYCIFSTGPFVEPIQIWDAPHLLRFGVTSNPPPMNELSIYRHLDPPHLHGYLVSKQGQFLLTPLPDGSTRLEGTTWYQHHLRPARYWQFWSDYIIHQIHLRVLRHIKTLAEADAAKGIIHG
jgi:hypothetical protein